MLIAARNSPGFTALPLGDVYRLTKTQPPRSSWLPNHPQLAIRLLAGAALGLSTIDIGLLMIRSDSCTAPAFFSPFGPRTSLQCHLLGHCEAPVVPTPCTTLLLCKSPAPVDGCFTGQWQFKADTPLLSYVATVDWDVGSGNERSARRAEPHDEFGHFIRHSDPSDRMKRVHHFTSANPSLTRLSDE
jgi:hypothetical protein